MKKLFYVLVIILILSSCTPNQNQSTNQKPEYSTNLILVHPTEYNLKLFNNLVEKKIIDIEGLQVTGVYHKDEQYDYSKSESYLVKNQLEYIKIHSIADTIYPEIIYQKNECSDDFENLFAQSNGIIFFGGPDMPPSIYGEETSLLTNVTDAYRHYFELSLLFHLLGGSQNSEITALLENNLSYTVLGICLGMQTMNVATGGTMIQDIPLEIYNVSTVEDLLSLNNTDIHRNYYNDLVTDDDLYSGHFHHIKILDGKLSSKEYDFEYYPLIYSNHHQAIETLGQNLVPAATNMDDKVIEAVTHKLYPNVYGVQFHPEGTYLHNGDEKYKVNPGAELMSGIEILKQNNSYRFHLDFWENFSNKLNEQ